MELTEHFPPPPQKLHHSNVFHNLMQPARLKTSSHVCSHSSNLRAAAGFKLNALYLSYGFSPTPRRQEQKMCQWRAEGTALLSHPRHNSCMVRNDVTHFPSTSMQRRNEMIRQLRASVGHECIPEGRCCHRQLSPVEQKFLGSVEDKQKGSLCSSASL